MNQEILQKLQQILTYNLMNINISSDIFYYDRLVDKIISSINNIIPNCNLTSQDVLFKLRSDHAMLTSIAPLKVLNGTLIVILSFNNCIVSNVEALITY